MSQHPGLFVCAPALLKTIEIDIITTASGLQFDDAYEKSLSLNIEGMELHIPSIDDLIRNTNAVGRTKDLADVEALESPQELRTKSANRQGITRFTMLPVFRFSR